jgi:hypothetical protein
MNRKLLKKILVVALMAIALRAVADPAADKQRDEKLKQYPDQIKKRVADMRGKLAATPDAAADPYINMGLYLADRFLLRMKSSQLPREQDASWSMLQMEEVEQVLDWTDKRIAAWPKFHELSPAPYRKLIGAPAVVKDGVFYTDTSTGKDQPFFYAGYGHFTQVFNDLPNFAQMGASLIQDGRAGPSGMDANGRLLEPGEDIIDSVHRAERLNMKVDYLLSPHYFPDWAAEKWPAAFAGAAGWSKQHEKLCFVIKQWIDALFPYIRDSSGLFSVCLDNEPTSSAAGRDRYTLPEWHKYLQATHGDIAVLNKLYGTSYASFDQVPVTGTGMPAKVEEQRAFFDWCQFNDQSFVEFNKWMSDTVHSQVPKIPTHSKIMVFFSLDRDKLGWGVDPEKFCDVTDLAGCDAYAFPTAGDFPYDWKGNEFFYDLLNSFHNQPVFNSENHIIGDGTGPTHVSPQHTRSVLWQGALHHQGATTIWVWEEQTDPALVGSIYFRPANIYAAGEAMMDLNRFGSEVAAINQQHPRIAMLYSRPSVFWQENYKDQLMSVYAQLNFLGEPITFVSEQQLAENRAAKVDVIILTQATHLTDATVAALQKFVQGGGKLIVENDGNCALDQYHQPRQLPTEIASAIQFKTSAKESDSARTLHQLLSDAGIKLNDLTDTAGQPTWGVEYRIVPQQDRTLVPMINLTGKERHVSLQALRGKVVDLLAGEEIDPANILLAPMTPRLLVVKQ